MVAMRSSFLSAVAILVTLCGRAVGRASESASASSSARRRLQDEQICQELRGAIEANTTAQDIEDSCDCFDMDSGATRLACRRDNACISSDGGTPMQGAFSAIFTKDGSGPSYTQTITAEVCFDYPINMYDGKKVCVSSVSDGFGTVATCEIKVGSDVCNVCRYCPIQLISFDCSNLGYEDRTACGDNNTDDSILQFLYKPELATGCTGGDGSDSSGGARPTSAPSTTTMSPSGGAAMVNAVATIFLGIIPLIFMG